MKLSFLTFLSRFRRRPQDPLHERTSAESQVEDYQEINPEPEEWKVYDEAAYERRQESLHNNFGTSSHGADNPNREKNP